MTPKVIWGHFSKVISRIYKNVEIRQKRLVSAFLLRFLARIKFHSSRVTRWRCFSLSLIFLRTRVVNFIFDFLIFDICKYLKWSKMDFFKLSCLRRCFEGSMIKFLVASPIFSTASTITCRVLQSLKLFKRCLETIF